MRRPKLYSEYINAKDLKRTFLAKGKDKLRLSTIINEIEVAQLFTDVVSVVRCKDCIHREKCPDKSDDDFCSDGERWEDAI